MRYYFLGLCLIFLISCHQKDSNQEIVTADKSSGAKACIERVLHLDDSLGTVRNHACESIFLSETIEHSSLLT